MPEGIEAPQPSKKDQVVIQQELFGRAENDVNRLRAEVRQEEAQNTTEHRARSQLSGQASSRARCEVAIRFNMFHRPAL